jgi:hypothetical protein
MHTACPMSRDGDYVDYVDYRDYGDYRESTHNQQLAL